MKEKTNLSKKVGDDLKNNVQIENGYTRIANEILEVLSSTKFSGTQYRILMVVFRSTYGFRKKEHKLSVSYIEKATGMNRQLVKKELKNMIENRILIEYKKATFNSPREIGFNKNYNEWSIDRYQEIKKEPGTNIGTTQETKRLPPQVPRKVPKKEIINKKETNKDIKEIHSYWIGILKDVNNARITENLKKVISKKLVTWEKDKILEAIKNYNTVLKSDYYYNSKWTLIRFIKQKNGVPRFIEGLDEEYDGDIWKEYKDTKFFNRFQNTNENIKSINIGEREPSLIEKLSKE